MNPDRGIFYLILAFAAVRATTAAVRFSAQAGPPAKSGVLIDAATLQDWMDKGQFQGAASCG